MSDYSLTTPDTTIDLPFAAATEGPGGIDVSGLLKESGQVTLDNGFVNTAACESSVTYIDGGAGILRYRGIPIEQFEQQPNFVEVAWLLIFILSQAVSTEGFDVTFHIMQQGSCPHNFQIRSF